jgi:hypothetical protein
LISTAISAIDCILAAVLTVVLLLAAEPAAAQTQWGQYRAPDWGQSVPPAWGQYNYTVGANGWRYNQTLKSDLETGAVLNPNQLGANGGKAPSIFTPPDTRLLGRTAP